MLWAAEGKGWGWGKYFGGPPLCHPASLCPGKSMLTFLVKLQAEEHQGAQLQPVVPEAGVARAVGG